MKLDFTDHFVLITGATRGIGKQLAGDFYNLGANLILTGTNPEQIRKLNETTGQQKKNITYHCVDFLDSESTTKFIDALDRYERIDVCINNAGINRINLIEQTIMEDWNDIIAVNLTAPFLIIKQVSKIMKKNRYGRILNISSIWGHISKEKRSPYSSSKFGLRGLTVTASIELARYNILVNMVSPGFVLTDLTKKILSEKEMKDLCLQIPAGRLANPDDISPVVLFLTSPLNRYITGQNIIVDGGFVNV
jgi:3-oxoacyl-[acyl-carrier protein] reductase